MNVSLTPEQAKFVSHTVQAGRYPSTSELVREALRLLEEREQSRAAQLAELKAELNRHLESLDRWDQPDRARAQRAS